MNGDLELNGFEEINKIVNEIKSERIRQDQKWGEQNHNLVEYMAILTEEVGEAAKDAVDYHFKNPLKTGDALTMEARQEIRLRSYRQELIQVAAVAIQMIESVDRNEIEGLR